MEAAPYIFEQILTRQEAKMLGLKTYFSGSKCRHGHVCERYTSCAYCVECSEIAAAKKNPEDARRRAKEWWLANRARAMANSVKWNRENPEKRKSIYMKWLNSSRKVRADKSREWHLKNKDIANASSRKYRANNPEARKESARKWKQSNPDKVNAATHRRRAKKRAVEGLYTHDDVRRIYCLQKGKCAYCRIALRGKYEIDHIVPLCGGGSNSARNIQLLCRNACNQSKGAKDPIDFAQSLGRLI